jgi:hypothetical protein
MVTLRLEGIIKEVLLNTLRKLSLAFSLDCSRDELDVQLKIEIVMHKKE